MLINSKIQRQYFIDEIQLIFMQTMELEGTSFVFVIKLK